MNVQFNIIPKPTKVKANERKKNDIACQNLKQTAVKCRKNVV